jgi:hypothetical protein
VLLYFIVIVRKPVILDGVYEDGVVAGLRKIVSLFLLELGNETGLKAIKVIKALEDGIMLVLEIGERGAALHIGLVVLDVGADPVRVVSDLVGRWGREVNVPRDVLLLGHQAEHLLTMHLIYLTSKHALRQLMAKVSSLPLHLSSCARRLSSLFAPVKGLM